MSRISSKNQVTLPVDALAAAGLSAGDDVTITADAPGRLVIRRTPRSSKSAIGIFDGLYEPEYLDRLREADWE